MRKWSRRLDVNRDFFLESAKSRQVDRDRQTAFLSVHVDSFRSADSNSRAFHGDASASTCASRRVDWPTVMSLMYTSTAPVRVGNDYRTGQSRVSRDQREKILHGRGIKYIVELRLCIPSNGNLRFSGGEKTVARSMAVYERKHASGLTHAFRPANGAA